MNGADLKRARLLMGWTQEQLSRELGWTSGRQVSQIERGAKPLQGQTALAVERLLIREGCWESYALGFGDEQWPNNANGGVK